MSEPKGYATSLRSLAIGIENSGGPVTAEIMREAADEAERLQRNYNEAREEVTAFRHLLDESVAERNRLASDLDEANASLTAVAEHIDAWIAAADANKADPSQPQLPAMWNCGWCGKRVGTIADPDYGNERGKEHSVTCKENPLVREVTSLRAALLAALNDRDEALSGESAAAGERDAALRDLAEMMNGYKSAAGERNRLLREIEKIREATIRAELEGV